MRVWIACFVVLFALAQLFDWVQKFSFPLPIYILGGAFLAVASNYEKLFGSYVRDRVDATLESPTEQLQLNAPSPTPVSFPSTSSSIENNSLELEAEE
ncbi:MAG: hypothetical protein QNJ63_19625 [Calothrix sp. MO_192.B10]|nr:hypothetical protein [Calothrix sp. MO_192.B10]